MKPEITPKQLQILKLIAKGYCSEDIGKQLGNSTKTIDNTRSNMLLRFRVSNAAELVSYGYENGFLKVGHDR